MVNLRDGAPEFDHRDSGTTEDQWSPALAAAESQSLELSRYRQLVVVAAHPDDETLGAGGLLAIAAYSGLSVTVLIATLGEKSHPASSTHTPSELALLRRAEVLAAVGVLAPAAQVRILGLPDGELAGHREELLAAIGDCVDGPSTLLVSPFVADGHPDHDSIGAVSAHVAGAAGATSLGYPIWMWHWGSPEALPAGLVRLDLGPQDVRVKRAALDCHRSQTHPLSDLPGDEAIVPPAFAAHFERDYEIFVTATPPDDDAVTTTVRRSDAPEPGDGGRSLTMEFFDDFYGAETDPWGFETRWYEKRKRALTLACLPAERFPSAYEPGCSIGVLTAALAPRCGRLLATDISDTPLRIARRRLAGAPGVRFEQRRVPQEWPDEQFDLIVLSEIGYYCDAEDLRTLVQKASASLTRDGVLLACHWRHPVQEYPLRGDDVHEALRSHSGLVVLAEHREADFLLEVYVRPPAISVAGAAGLLG